jgi:hypothetical protein
MYIRPEPVCAATVKFTDFIWDELALAPNAGKSSASAVCIDALSLKFAVQEISSILLPICSSPYAATFVLTA